MTQPSRFVIAGTQRTGTTLLRTSLSSHPRIECRGEVFKLGKRPYTLPDGYWAFSRRTVLSRVRATVQRRASTQRYLSELYGRTDVEATGYKLMLNQCCSRPYIWSQTQAYDVSVIHMTRRNVLKTLVSRQAAARSGVYHVSATLPVKSAVKDWAARSVILDSSTLLGELDAIAAESLEWRRRIGRSRFMDLHYEDYVADQGRWNNLILEFLGVSAQPLHSDLKKVNPDSLGALVANFDEVAALLRHSQYAYCLESDGT